jgi:hypothetical protein
MTRNLLFAALLTVVIETSFLAAMGYRSRLFVITCVLINFVTNVTLNVTVMLLPAEAVRLLQYPLEISIVFIEWGVLKFFVSNKRKLLAFVFLANLISFLTGLLLFGSV